MCVLPAYTCMDHIILYVYMYLFIFYVYVPKIWYNLCCISCLCRLSKIKLIKSKARRSFAAFTTFYYYYYISYTSSILVILLRPICQATTEKYDDRDWKWIFSENILQLIVSIFIQLNVSQLLWEAKYHYIWRWKIVTISIYRAYTCTCIVANEPGGDLYCMPWNISHLSEKTLMWPQPEREVWIWNQHKISGFGWYISIP